MVNNMKTKLNRFNRQDGYINNYLLNSILGIGMAIVIWIAVGPQLKTHLMNAKSYFNDAQSQIISLRGTNIKNAQGCYAQQRQINRELGL